VRLTGSRVHPKARRLPIPRRSRSVWIAQLSAAFIALVLSLLAWAIIARRLAPTSNTSLNRFDAIIVLGTPTDSDGNPTPVQLATVTEAVHEYERGAAPRLILTGAAVANEFVEARVMARTAQAQGIPESSLFVEPEARDTIHNACYALRIMKTHEWHSAEVVSAAPHEPRSALIFSRLPMDWRMHAAPPPTPQSAIQSNSAAVLEVLKTVRYLVWSRQAEHCEP